MTTQQTKKVRREETIKICGEHLEYQTPLIWTFSFNYKEYWCPVCGNTYGMLGAGEDVTWTKKLQNRLDKYKKLSRKFLNAKSALICAYMERKGQRIKFVELPEKAKQYYISQSKKWKYKFR